MASGSVTIPTWRRVSSVGSINYEQSLHLSKALFTRREGNPTARVTLARGLKDSSGLQAKFSGRVTLTTSGLFRFGYCYSETFKLGFLVCFPLFSFNLLFVYFLVFSTSSLVVSIRYCPLYCL